MQEKIKTPLDSIAPKPAVYASVVTAGFGMEMQMSSVLLENARKLQDLAEDLRLVAEGKFPSPLEQMPVLLDWNLSARLVPHLVGCAAGHPILGNRHISTSQLFFLDAELGLARTLSRWYRLDPPIDAGQDPKRH
jgi:hypothetical protein